MPNNGRKGTKKVNDFRRTHTHTHTKNRPSFGLTSSNKAVCFCTCIIPTMALFFVVQINFNPVCVTVFVFRSLSFILRCVYGFYFYILRRLSNYEHHIKSQKWSHESSGIINAYASENEFETWTITIQWRVLLCTEIDEFVEKLLLCGNRLSHGFLIKARIVDKKMLTCLLVDSFVRSFHQSNVSLRSVQSI